MNYSLIESLLVEDIEEQEQSKKPNLENYALMIDPGRHSSTFVLYKPEYYAN